MARLKIDNDLLAEEFFEDSFILGIMAPVPDYYFCSMINSQLGMDFRNDLTSEIQLRRKKRNYFFSVFRYEEKNTSLTHVLYNNRFDGHYLLPECRHIDFVWMIQGITPDLTPIRQLTQILRNLKEVQLLAELGADKIIHKKNLIF